MLKGTMTARGNAQYKLCGIIYYVSGNPFIARWRRVINGTVKTLHYDAMEEGEIQLIVEEVWASDIPASSAINCLFFQKDR